MGLWSGSDSNAVKIKGSILDPYTPVTHLRLDLDLVLIFPIQIRLRLFAAAAGLHAVN